jgi:hypothetical protein
MNETAFIGSQKHYCLRYMTANQEQLKMNINISASQYLDVFCFETSFPYIFFALTKTLLIEVTKSDYVEN